MGNDAGSQVPNAPLDRFFVAESQYTGRKQCCVIVIRQLLVGTIDDRIFVFPVTEDTNL